MTCEAEAARKPAPRSAASHQRPVWKDIGVLALIIAAMDVPFAALVFFYHPAPVPPAPITIAPACTVTVTPPPAPMPVQRIRHHQPRARHAHPCKKG